MKVLEHFIGDFCHWGLINESGVINSVVKSRVCEALESQDSEHLEQVALSCG